MTDLSLIIVSWNVADLLRACLNSIQEAELRDYSLEIIVVDSASSDGTADMLHREFPQVNVLAQTENLGFTRCNNIGLAVAQGRYVMLLNPDTEVIGDALAQMAAYLDTHPDTGIIGPQTLNTDGSHQTTRRRFPTLTTAFFESTWLQAYAPKRVLDYYYVHDLADDATGAVDWVQGSALMARHGVYEQIGGLDDGYVMYSEEMDWCKRAKTAGWSVVYLGSAQIVHHGGKSSEQSPARAHILFQESKLRYFHKHHGRGSAEVLRLFLILNYLWQIGLEGVKSLLGHKRATRQERIKTYWQVLRSGLKVN